MSLLHIKRNPLGHLFVFDNIERNPLGHLFVFDNIERNPLGHRFVFDNIERNPLGHLFVFDNIERNPLGHRFVFDNIERNPLDHLFGFRQRRNEPIGSPTKEEISKEVTAISAIRYQPLFEKFVILLNNELILEQSSYKIITLSSPRLKHITWTLQLGLM